MTIINYSAGPDGLNVEWQSGETSEFSYFWLRDNACDPVSFDSQSHQRELFTAMGGAPAGGLRTSRNPA